MASIEQAVDKLYKDHFGKMVSVLLYASRDIDLETAEDLVQDSFSAALTDWKTNGIPLNPAGWIYKVCRNKALNKIKKEKRIEGLDENTFQESVEIRFSESVLDDQQLKLLFACAHPDLSPKVQVVITLKYVVNLKVDAIAGVLGMTVDGVDKLLLRARQKIRDEKILLEEPPPAALQPRLPTVHKIIYLIFNEGYKSFRGTEIIREELCEEALLLNKALLDAHLGNKDTAALHALMLLNSARFKSRFGLSGELLNLEEQDRSLWDKALIQLGSDFLHASKGEEVTSYHLEASIAFLHCRAHSFADTDWTTITQLYARLLKEHPNPFVELNYAIALFYSGQRLRAFQILHALERQPILNQYYILNSALGKLHHLEGQDDLARPYLKKAYEQTGFAKEREFIQKMIDEIATGDL